MRRHRALAIVAMVLYIHPDSASPQSGQKPDEHIGRIVGTAIADGGAYRFLQTLTDSIGGRVTGTVQSRRTADLLLAMLRESGFGDAHFEPYELSAPWSQRAASASVVAPTETPLTVASYGWVPGTSGDVTGPLVDLGSPASNNIQLPEAVRGAVVIGEPRALAGVPSQVMRASLARALARAGAVALFIPSDKPNRMLYTSAFGFYPRGALPVLSIAKEDVLLLRRLLANGPVRVRLNVTNSFDTSPIEERNVIAEISGIAPEEVVLVGAHFDSWDGGQGAQDDGVGVAAVLETARILKGLGIRPRRTIRFAFFSGEEQGLLGSRAYVERHRDELNGLRAVLIMDQGAYAPRGFNIHGRTDIEAAARSLLAPLSKLGASGVTLEADFAMDHAPFLAEGVPVFTRWVDESEYDIHHHAISDTFDKVDPQLLALDTAVMAVASYSMANAPEMRGRRLSAAESTQLLERLGIESLRRAVYHPTDTTR
jgi:Iap family predicted aminopeptidase